MKFDTKMMCSMGYTLKTPSIVDLLIRLSNTTDSHRVAVYTFAMHYHQLQYTQGSDISGVDTPH
jgi:hypothetical protein